MAEQREYFVGRDSGGVYRCYRSFYARDTYGVPDIIWRGTDFFTGQRVAKEANARIRAARSEQPKQGVLL